MGAMLHIARVITCTRPLAICRVNNRLWTSQYSQKLQAYISDLDLRRDTQKKEKTNTCVKHCLYIRYNMVIKDNRASNNLDLKVLH